MTRTIRQAGKQKLVFCRERSPTSRCQRVWQPDGQRKCATAPSSDGLPTGRTGQPPIPSPCRTYQASSPAAREHGFCKWIVVSHSITMIDASLLILQDRLDRLSPVCDCPDVLRTAVLRPRANQATTNTLLQQSKGLSASENAHRVAKSLELPGLAWRCQSKVTGVALMLRIAAIANTLSQLGQRTTFSRRLARLLAVVLDWAFVCLARAYIIVPLWFLSPNMTMRRQGSRCVKARAVNLGASRYIAPCASSAWPAGAGRARPPCSPR